MFKNESTQKKQEQESIIRTSLLKRCLDTDDREDIWTNA